MDDHTNVPASDISGKGWLSWHSHNFQIYCHKNQIVKLHCKYHILEHLQSRRNKSAEKLSNFENSKIIET